MATVRTAVITGAGSGIGKATKELLTERGERVIGVDIKGSDITADLSSPSGIDDMVAEVADATDGRIDSIYAVAGISAPIPETVAINYFGAVGALEGLRPLLAGSAAPTAVAVASAASLHPADDDLIDACLAMDRDVAMARAKELVADEQRAFFVYSSSKAALARWIRRNSIVPAWAGAGIPLNGVAPGVVKTPMTADLLASAEGSKLAFESTPAPLNGALEARDIAEALAFLGAASNRHICGQVLFVDSGTDATLRRDTVW